MTWNLENIYINDDGLVFNPATGEISHIEKPATRLLPLFRRGVSEAEIFLQLLGDHHGDKRAALEELDTVLTNLEQMEVIRLTL